MTPSTTISGSDAPRIGVDAANLDLRAAARRTGVGLNVGAGDLALQRLVYRCGGNGIDLIARDERRGCRGEAAFDSRRLAGDDHRVEEQRVALEPDRHRTVGNGHRHVGGRVPDSAHEQRNGHGVDEDGEAAIIARLGRAAPAQANGDHGSGHRLPVAGVGDRSSDWSLLRNQRRGRNEGRDDNPADQACWHCSSNLVRSDETTHNKAHYTDSVIRRASALAHR